ncbi:MAG: HTTM domain-containing protein [Planctomycetaceae bacterium]|nr:HTTM domain-containing protein [Planctomycetaceae bacterium]
MRRVLNLAVVYVADSARSLAQWWNAFWYTPADPTLLGVVRILTGLMLLYTHAVWGMALDAFFGPTAWLSKELVLSIQSDQFAYSFWWLVPSNWMWPAYGVSMLILALFTIGLWTRVTSIMALVVVISFAHRVPEALFGLDQINALLTLYLAIGKSGQALSVDRRMALRRRGAAAAQPAPSVSANLAQRLINVHMCVIYFFAGAAKLQGPAWWNGEAMWRAFANLEYQSTDMTWLAWHPWLSNLVTHVSVLWEIFFCVLIWRPRWRPVMLAGAVVMHVGIGACLGMWTFGLIMLVGCASFLPNEAVRQFVAALVPGRIAATPAARPLRDSPRETVDRVRRRENPEPVLTADQESRRRL